MLRLCTAAALAALSFASHGNADEPDTHPHYRHALADLRYARYLVNRPEEHKLWADQKEATHSIGRAIAEIKRAAIESDTKEQSKEQSKKANVFPAPPSTWNHDTRLRKALELLESALRDLRWDEDDNRGLDWRMPAIQNTREALALTRKALAPLTEKTNRE